MRTSCNGCRVLRKGCSENCEIRPCLEWIKSPDSQANATLFLAKFYGRAGLLNLINAGAQNDRPGIFKSLLYEACGRIVNPTFGSVGLYSSGNWEQCQAAVDAVLSGSPIVGMNAVGACAGAGPSGPQLSATKPTPTTLNACDIRHVAKDSNIGKTTRNRSKKTMTRTKFQPGSVAEPSSGSVMAQYSNASVWAQMNLQEFCPSSSQGYGSGVETVEASMVMSRDIPNPVGGGDHHEEEEVGLELTLGFVSVKNREG